MRSCESEAGISAEIGRLTRYPDGPLGAKEQRHGHALSEIADEHECDAGHDGPHRGVRGALDRAHGDDPRRPKWEEMIDLTPERERPRQGEDPGFAHDEAGSGDEVGRD